MQSRHMQTIYKRRCYCAMNIYGYCPKNVNNNCNESNISIPPKTKQRERDREKPNSYTWIRTRTHSKIRHWQKIDLAADTEWSGTIEISFVNSFECWMILLNVVSLRFLILFSCCLFTVTCRWRVRVRWHEKYTGIKTFNTLHSIQFNWRTTHTITPSCVDLWCLRLNWPLFWTVSFRMLFDNPKISVFLWIH